MTNNADLIDAARAYAGTFISDDHTAKLIHHLTEALEGAESELQCFRDDDPRWPWTTPDGDTHCCIGHWVKQKGWPRIQTLEAEVEQLKQTIEDMDYDRKFRP